MKKIFCLLSFIFCLAAQAQELNCRVSVNSSKLQGTNTQVFETLEKALTEFMSERRWTEYQYTPEERIDCSIMITVDEMPNDNTFGASLQIQARRPVFGSTYMSPLINMQDENFKFVYNEFEPIEFNENTFGTNLSSVMAFYAYYIIGMYSDSFSKMGGTAVFRKAENIVTQAQSTTEDGWKAYEGKRNRYDIIQSIVDDRVRRFREFYYEYHRLGLDEMGGNMNNARAAILKSMEALREVNKLMPASLTLQMFFDAKNEEIVGIFSGGTPAEKTTVFALLKEVNIAQLSKYQEILKQ
ncbi:MAG: DUF4835 family protein [Prevotellaceae bacterium]|jgi:hypothetical protein|nr:DUF4835 family protein [Prevotellaceae bacterium]